jgi:heme oxygenase
MQTTVSSDAAGVMLRLKEATAELHTRAERSEFQSRLIRGVVTRGEYADWLGQLLLIHEELEPRVREFLGARPALAGLIPAELYQAARLRADLAHFGVAPDSLAPCAAAARVIGAIRAAATNAPAALLGFYYVLEGSKNGSKYIAKALRRTLGLVPGAGDRYLDPHGEDQPRLWGDFKRGMDAVGFEEAEVAAMIDAACAMFEAAGGIGHAGTTTAGSAGPA